MAINFMSTMSDPAVHKTCYEYILLLFQADITQN